MQGQIAKFQYRFCFRLPYFDSGVSAGFPSPAEDWSDERLDLNEYAVKNPAATFFVRARGDSMTGAGIYDGDILVVDRSLTASPNQIVIAIVDGEFTVKYLRRVNLRNFLEAANAKYPAIVLTPDSNAEIWGVVTLVLHTPR